MNVSFGSKVRPRAFGCVVMGSAVWLILRSTLFLYYPASRVKVKLFCLDLV